MDNIEDEMKRRIGKGEFRDSHGDLDIYAVIEATTELTKTRRNAIYSITGLWAGKGKVAFEGRTSEDLSIPAGSKILVFNNNKENDQQPDLNLCYVED